MSSKRIIPNTSSNRSNQRVESDSYDKLEKPHIEISATTLAMMYLFMANTKKKEMKKTKEVITKTRAVRCFNDYS